MTRLWNQISCSSVIHPGPFSPEAPQAMGHHTSEWNDLKELHLTWLHWWCCAYWSGYKWGTLTVWCQHHIDKVEKEVCIAFRHLVMPIDEVSQFKFDVQFIRKPIIGAMLWAWIRRRWRTIGWKCIPILVANLACEKTQYVVLQNTDGVSTYHLAFGGTSWYIFALELSGVEHWGG